MTRIALTVGVALVLSAGSALAGKFNKKLSIGDPTPAFTELENVDGKKLSLADFKDKDVLVLAITCNHCPVAQDYEDRVMEFAKKHAGSATSKVGFVAININTIPDDALPAMKIRAEKKGYTFPYLYDPSQKIGRALGAKVTPEFFVLDKGRKVVYMGAMDDNIDPKNVKTRYLEAAVNAALKSEKPSEAETEPLGCDLKYLDKK